jgi:hypothetical protein
MEQPPIFELVSRRGVCGREANPAGKVVGSRNDRPARGTGVPVSPARLSRRVRRHPSMQLNGRACRGMVPGASGEHDAGVRATTLWPRRANPAKRRRLLAAAAVWQAVRNIPVRAWTEWVPLPGTGIGLGPSRLVVRLAAEATENFFGQEVMRLCSRTAILYDAKHSTRSVTFSPSLFVQLTYFQVCHTFDVIFPPKRKACAQVHLQLLAS